MGAAQPEREVVADDAVTVPLQLPLVEPVVEPLRVVERARGGHAETPAVVDGVAHTLGDHRVLEVAGVADESPARAARTAEVGERVGGLAELRAGRSTGNALLEQR